TASSSLNALPSAASCAHSAAERTPAINGSRHPRPRARRLSGARALRIDHFCDATTGGCVGRAIGFATTSVLFASSAGTLAPGWKLHSPDLDDSACISANSCAKFCLPTGSAAFAENVGCVSCHISLSLDDSACMSAKRCANDSLPTGSCGLLLSLGAGWKVYVHAVVLEWF